jgi:hypothetical protein
VGEEIGDTDRKISILPIFWEKFIFFHQKIFGKIRIEFFPKRFSEKSDFFGKKSEFLGINPIFWEIIQFFGRKSEIEKKSDFFFQMSYFVVFGLENVE